eukprot:7144699-Prymnesium_polylepis.1
MGAQFVQRSVRATRSATRVEATRLRALQLAVWARRARRRRRTHRTRLALGALRERAADGVRHEPLRIGLRAHRTLGSGHLRDHFWLRARDGHPVSRECDQHAGGKREEHGQAPALQHRLAVAEVVASLIIHLDALVLHAELSVRPLTRAAGPREACGRWCDLRFYPHNASEPVTCDLWEVFVVRSTRVLVPSMADVVAKGGIGRLRVPR